MRRWSCRLCARASCRSLSSTFPIHKCSMDIQHPRTASLSFPLVLHIYQVQHLSIHVSICPSVYLSIPHARAR